MCVISGVGRDVTDFVGLEAENLAHIDYPEGELVAANDASFDPSRYMTLVHRVARRVARSLPAHICYSDLVGAGTVGLYEAATRFEPSKGRFSAFAEFRIRGAIMDELRRYDLMGRNARLRRKRLDRLHARLTSQLGRPPAETEMAEALQTNVAALRRLQQDSEHVEVLSLEPEGGSCHGRRTLEIVAPEPPADHTLAVTELRDRLNSAVSRLSERQGRIVRMYYLENLTLKQIGLRVGISESRVCQILRETTRQLRTELTAQGVEELVA